MDFMFQPGFLGTRAPLFMDIVSVIVFLLPFLSNPHNALGSLGYLGNAYYVAHQPRY